jgi:2-dehydropantoate 2-reductase
MWLNSHDPKWLNFKRPLTCDRILAKLSPDGKTSMLQDIEAGRKTEVEMFAGKVVSLGYKYQIPTPINAAILRIMNVLESIGRG